MHRLIIGKLSSQQSPTKVKRTQISCNVLQEACTSTDRNNADSQSEPGPSNMTRQTSGNENAPIMTPQSEQARVVMLKILTLSRLA